jgi:hypothetical protein
MLVTLASAIGTNGVSRNAKSPIDRSVPPSAKVTVDRLAQLTQIPEIRYDSLFTDAGHARRNCGETKLSIEKSLPWPINSSTPPSVKVTVARRTSWNAADAGHARQVRREIRESQFQSERRNVIKTVRGSTEEPGYASARGKEISVGVATQAYR